MVAVKDLYEQVYQRVPVKQYARDPTDFRGILRRALKDYLTLIDWLKQEGILSVSHQ